VSAVEGRTLPTQVVGSDHIPAFDETIVAILKLPLELIIIELLRNEKLNYKYINLLL
jgi:hypothetical protein